MTPDRPIGEWTVYGTSTHQLPTSSVTTDTSTAAAPVVDWDHEFEKSRLRHESVDAAMRQLDKELEDKIAKLKADTENKKEALRRRVLRGNRARLRELLGRLNILSDYDIPESDEEDVEKVETTTAAAMISPHGDEAKRRYEKEDCAVESAYPRPDFLIGSYQQGIVPISSIRRTSGDHLGDGC